MRNALLPIIALGIGVNTAAAQEPVNIVYPIDGSTVPITGPNPGSLNSAYFTVSFGATCGGGPFDVEWGFDGSVLNSAKAYDQISVQQVWKLSGGKHILYVKADCGEQKVRFAVGN